jgi:hypothetical protein
MQWSSGHADVSAGVIQRLLLLLLPPCVPGAKFFPGFVNDKRRAALDQAALGWQADGRSRLRTLDRMSVDQHHAALLPGQATGGVVL